MRGHILWLLQVPIWFAAGVKYGCSEEYKLAIACIWVAFLSLKIWAKK